MKSGSARAYLLAAAVVDDRHRLDVQATLIALRLRGARSTGTTRATTAVQLAEAVGELSVRYMVVQRVSSSERSERRRRLCLTRLLLELDQLDVAEICLESRERRQNLHDLTLLAGLRAQRIVRPRVRMHHRPGPEEPLLWIADIVAGSVGAERRGDMRFAEHLVGKVSRYEV